LAFIHLSVLLLLGAFIFPRELVEGRLIATGTIAVLGQVEFLAFVVFDTHAVLVAPAVALSIEAARFHAATI
jgi:hypothetical protein